MKNKLKIWIYFLFFKLVLGFPLINILPELLKSDEKQDFVNKMTNDMNGIVSDIDLQNVEQLSNSLGLAKGNNIQLMQMLSKNLMTKTPEGDNIIEGDIVKHVPRKKQHSQPKLIKEEGDLWPDAIIPFTFHESVDEEHKNLIKEAMAHWQENTCIRFRTKKLKDKHYIRFRTDTSGCWSAVGLQSDNKKGYQDISLGHGCFKFYTAVHEIGHTIGYYHEHSRRDRNKFIEIIWNNVKSGMNPQFQMKNTRNELLEYDYRSIMHYPAWAFSKTPLKDNVILSKNPFFQYQIDEEKNSISFRDIKLTNKLYKCTERCSHVNELECQNEGILVPNKANAKECVCLCPPGFGGKNCEKIEDKTKVEVKEPKCGGNISTEGIITTPNYPERSEEYQSCCYWIKAPINQRVKLTFEDFSFAQPYGANEKLGEKGLCLYESVDIRKSQNIYKGSIYCGQQIKSKTVMESEGRDFIIIIIADDQMKGRGLKARVNFIQSDNDSEEQPEETASVLSQE